jgi:hypothetical protein
MVAVSKSALDAHALAMMSSTYYFELKNPAHTMWKTIGHARVTAVVIHESLPPELLVQPQGQDPAFYCIDELTVSSALSLAV